MVVPLALRAERTDFIFNCVISECLTVSCQRHGCCVLQRCLDHADQPHRSLIIEQVVRHARKLVLDPFGNYVVQYVLDLKSHELTLGVARALRGSFAELSVQKFSSNVIEKCLNSQAEEVSAMEGHMRSCTLNEHQHHTATASLCCALSRSTQTHSPPTRLPLPKSRRRSLSWPLRS